jgi:hypothetical protein
MNNNESLRLDDPALYAQAEFVKAGFSYGSIIKTEWFYEKFDLPMHPETVAQYNETTMLYARYLGKLRELLLVNHKMALRTKPGIGQEVIIPAEQTGWAMQEFRTLISKEIDRARDRIAHVNGDKLTDEERRENRDAVSNLSFFKRSGLKKIGF